MYRKGLDWLKKWKSKPNRKPLIIKGARQVGKTWLMKEFGRQCYKKTVYINFDANKEMAVLFKENIEPKRLILGLEIYAKQQISAEDTLLIFDEVQEVPQALSSLKYFCEEAPEYHIVCAGSLLGIALHNGTSFPVGKVDFLELYPLSFEEFLQAIDEEPLVSLLHKKDFAMIKSFKDRYIELLKLYYFIGGMPEAVSYYTQYKDINEVRAIQKRILEAYEQDFSKHAPNDIVPKIRLVWNVIPSQLAKETKKFIYGQIRKGARAKDFETAIMWLSDCGLIHKINRVTVPNLPLKAYEDISIFKLYMLDVGLLSCMTGIQQQILLLGSDIFKESKGALTEQYVLQQMIAGEDWKICYYTNDRNSAEIDFLVDDGAQVIPLEVKASENLKAKSLKAYCQKYKPQIAVRTSMSDYRKDTWLTNIPLYCIQELKSIVSDLSDDV